MLSRFFFGTQPQPQPDSRIWFGMPPHSTLRPLADLPQLPIIPDQDAHVDLFRPSGPQRARTVDRRTVSADTLRLPEGTPLPTVMDTMLSVPNKVRAGLSEQVYLRDPIKIPHFYLEKEAVSAALPPLFGDTAFWESSYLANRFREACNAHSVTPSDAAKTFITLSGIWDGGRPTEWFSDRVRKKALNVAIQMHGLSEAPHAIVAVKAMRTRPWADLLNFAPRTPFSMLSYAAGVADIESPAIAARFMKDTFEYGIAQRLALRDVNPAQGASEQWWYGEIDKFIKQFDCPIGRDALLLGYMREKQMLPSIDYVTDS